MSTMYVSPIVLKLKPVESNTILSLQSFSYIFFFRIRRQDLQLQDDLQTAEMKINRLRLEKQAKAWEDNYYTADEEYYHI